MKTPRGQKYVDALLVARRKIELEEEYYICCALPDNLTGYKLKEWISWPLGDYASVGTWLRDKHQIWATGEQLLAYRLRWIDHMIEQVRP